MKSSTILIFLGIVFFSCENDISVVNSLKFNESVPIESSYNVESLITDSGRIRISIKSPQVDNYLGDNQQVEMPKGIDIIFYDTTGHITSSLKANYAINNITRRTIIVKYNVVATNTDGEKLYTEELLWDQDNRKIYTNKPVKVVSVDKIIFGEGMTADETMNNWQIMHPHGEIDAGDLGK